MDRFDVIDRFIGDVGVTRTLQALTAAVQRHIEQLGFACFTYALLWPDEKAPSPPRFISTYPKEWVVYYQRQRYAPHNLVYAAGMQAILPFTWHDINRSRHLSPIQRTMFEEAKDAGVPSGATVPVHGPGRARGSFSVASALPDVEFMRLFAARRHHLHLMAAYAHEHFVRLDAVRDTALVPNLTPRETEVLMWTARGETMAEIADRLAISATTVRAHLDKASAKLGASNKTHATAVALVHALIEL